MKLRSAISILFISISIIAYSQEDDFFSSGNNDTSNPKRERKLQNWSFGGNFWASFGSLSSYVEVSPVALYRFSPRLMAGPGFSYIYRKSSYYEYQTHMYGPRAMATYTLFAKLDEMLNINIGNIVLHSEFEYLNLEKITPYIVQGYGGHINEGRTWIPNLLVGGGIYQPLGQRGGISLLVLYSCLENDYYSYSNPVIRVGFYF